LTAAFCRGESFLVQGLDTNAAQVRESREHFLAAQLDDPLPWVRVATMETLAAIGPEAVGPLLRVIEQDDGSPRLRALIVLADMGPQARAAVPVLRRLPKDPAVAQRAAQAMAAIEGSATTATLAAGSNQPVRSVAQIPSVSQPGVNLAETDWPQFHGPRRDAICRETNLNTDWTAHPPKLLWKIEGLGKGYSTVSIAGGRIFTMGDREPPGQPEQQYVLAFDLETQRELWATPIGPPHRDGPRCTPTVDGELLYALGTSGDLVCLEAATGKLRWKKNFERDFGGKMMSVWKFSESPLVDGPRLVCTPGGPDATLVALDKTTGGLIWKCAVPSLGERGKDGAAYSSMVVAEIEGVRQYVQLLGRGVVGVEAETGRFLWGYNGVANSIANITTPIVRGNYVFASTAYGTGSVLLKITRRGDRFTAEEVYFKQADDFQNHHGGVVLVGDYLYGGHGQNRGVPTCVEFATGRIAWKAEAPERGSAAVLYFDGNLLFRYDRGPIYLVEATPEAFHIKGSFTPLRGEGPAWPHPVIHQGRLYLRHADLLLCYDLRKQQ